MWKDILSVTSTSTVRTGPDRPPLAFTVSDLHIIQPNLHIPLLIRAVMANMEGRRILVDQESSVDIIFEDLLEVLKISRKSLTPYSGRDLSGFNGASTKPLGHLELMVTFGDPDSKQGLFKTVKTTILVLPCKSQYQCIIGRPTIGKLEAVTSTLHLNMKFYNLENKVVTVSADIGAARRCYHLTQKIERQSDGSCEISKGKRQKGKELVTADVNMVVREDGYNPETEEDKQATILRKKRKSKIERRNTQGLMTAKQLADSFFTTMRLDTNLPKKDHSKSSSCQKR